jgi:hypothetical protein
MSRESGVQTQNKQKNEEMEGHIVKKNKISRVKKKTHLQVKLAPWSSSPRGLAWNHLFCVSGGRV